MNVGGGRSVASVAVKNRLGKEKKMKAIKLAVGFVSVFVAGGVLGGTLKWTGRGDGSKWSGTPRQAWLNYHDERNMNHKQTEM